MLEGNDIFSDFHIGNAHKVAIIYEAFIVSTCQLDWKKCTNIAGPISESKIRGLVSFKH